MGEEIIPQIAECSLSHIYHDSVVGVSGNNAYSVKYGYLAYGAGKRGEIRLVRQQERSDVVVDQVFRKHGSLYIGDNSHKNQYKDAQTVDFVILKNISHQTH